MGHKVLLADDSITVQKIVKLSLTEEGIEVIAFGNGEQAVAQIESVQPDLVMADVFMPGKDGYEVCEFVKAHPQLKNTPVILLVHAFEPFDPERAKEVCADHQLTKPFQSIRTLVSTVQDLLSKAGPKPAAEPAATLSQPMEPPRPITPIEGTVAEPPTAMPGYSGFAPETMPAMDEGFISPSIPELASVNASSVFSNQANDVVTAPSEPSRWEAPMTGTPISLTPPPAIEAGSEILTPPPITGGLLSGDLMPPLDLPEISPSGWQTTAGAPTSSVAQEPMPAASEAATFAPLPETAMPAAPAASPVNMMAAAPEPAATASFMSAHDDVLDLPEIMPNAAGVTSTFAAPSAMQDDETPVLAVFGSMPMDLNPLQMTPAASESVPAPVARQGMDLGVGSLEPQHTQENLSQDIQMGAIAPQSAPVNQVAPQMAEAMISEAMIEEIVNRVVQRLSTKAIQEIAWEVVPEMAELLIRKQISQQKHLSH